MGNGRNIVWSLGIAGLSLLSACSGKPGTASDKGAKPAVAVVAVAVTAADLDETVAVVGTLAPKFAADVKSEMTAVVAEVYVAEWVRVKKGTPLARLDTREEEATLEGYKAAVLQAEVAETRALREFERAGKLKEAGLLTQQGLDDAKSAHQAAQATTQAARAQLNAAEARLAKAVLRAPMDGVVSYRGVSAGDRVENMGDGIAFTLVDTSVFDLTFTVPSTRIEAVKVGQAVRFTTDALPGRTFEGSVAFINPAADPSNRAVRVVAQVPNPDGALRAGLFVKGTIVTGRRPGVVQVPAAAFLSWDVEAKKAELFVIAGTTARRTAIRTGDTFDGSVEVTEGLKAGDLVATRGAFNLSDGDTVSVTKTGE
jgi:RND family efflux transporter MFP subunit